VNGAECTTFATSNINKYTQKTITMKKINPILYDVYATPNPDKEGEQLYHPRIFKHGNQMNDDELKEYLQRNTRVNSSQFVGMIEALVEEIPQQLLLNKYVHIRGMGTFYLKIGIRPRTDKNGQQYIPKFSDPKSITSNDLQVEGIGFRADPKWNRIVTHSKQHFERLEQRHQANISKSQLLLYIDNKMEEQGFVTVRDLIYDQQTTKYHARKLLEELSTGKQPKLYRIKVGRIFLYKRYGK